MALINYLTQKFGMRMAILAFGVVLGSVCLFIGIALVLFVPSSHVYTIGGRLFAMSFFAAALTFDLFIAWIYSAARRLSFTLAFVKSSVTILIVTIFVSMAVMRGNWLEIMKETAQRLW